MIAIYRMCGIPSTNPSPVFQEDKFKLNQLCLRSFLRAFKDVDIKVVYLLDNCDARYRLWIQSMDSKALDIIESQSGINETMLKAYEIANNQDDDILFQECDYLYLPGTGSSLIGALDELKLISPYDHPDHYQNPDMEVRLVNNQHYRKARNNTMTFAVKNKTFKEHYNTFYKYGYLDHDVWNEVSAKGNKLFVPMPSFATHMVTACMAPGIDWQAEWQKYS